MRERSIGAGRLVEHWNVRLNRRSLTSHPISGRTVGTIGGQALRTEFEALFGALNHCACRADLGLPDRSRRLDVDDDRTFRSMT